MGYRRPTVSEGHGSFHRPSSIYCGARRQALAEEKRTNSPLIWRQEFEGEFTSLDSAALIDVTKLLQPDGTPWPDSDRYDSIFVVIDSAIKVNPNADGTAALYCGVTATHTEHKTLWLL